MIHPDTELRFISPEIGYGVFATRPIPHGTLIWTQCLFDRVIPASEAVAMSPSYQDVLGKYAYIDMNANFVLCWDAGRYVNHSCEPAMLGVDLGYEISVRDLQPGDEVTCEYGSLNLTSQLNCRCRSPLCRGTISGEDTNKYWREWDSQVAAALQLAAHVAQPLLPFARDPALLNDFASGLKPVPSYRDQNASLDVVMALGDSVQDPDRPWAFRRPASA